jgi:hypothetical protein
LIFKEKEDSDLLIACFDPRWSRTPMDHLADPPRWSSPRRSGGTGRGSVRPSDAAAAGIALAQLEHWDRLDVEFRPKPPVAFMSPRRTRCPHRHHAASKFNIRPSSG